MQGRYPPLDSALQGAQGMALIALVLCLVHISDCAGTHEKLIRKQVKQECLREAP